MSHALLPRWANDQDGWCRAIAGDVLKNRTQPSNLDIDRYLKLLLSEKKLSPDPFEAVPKIEEKEIAGNPLDPVRLDSLKVGDGVNALKPGAQIDFAPGVTVIFGENGSGKSGFVRVLKRAAGLRTAEDILHNVRTDTKPTPSAVFTVAVGTAGQTIEWKNEFGIVPLNRVSIFDARGARLHVEDDLTYVYTPGELTLFPLVQNGIERVRTALEARITARTPGPNTILATFDRSCSIYPIIETLGAATDLEEIKKYAVLPENIDATIDSLTIEVDALKSSNIQNELKRSRDRAAVVKTLKSAIETAKTFDVTTYASRVKARDQASRRRDEAGNKAFEGVGIPGVLSDEWRQFIQAGEEYLKKNTAPTYPGADDPCAYCQQPLTAKAVELVKKYRDFSNNEIKAALDTAESQLRDYVAPVLNIKADTLQQQLTAETNGGPDILDRVAPVVAQVKQLTLTVAGGSMIDWKDKDASLATAGTVVSGEETRLTALIAGLQHSVDERRTALVAKQAELTELKGKKTANTLLPQIEKRVSDAKWVGRATIVKGNLTAVLRSLTEAAKVAGEELLNKDFGKRFEDECKMLRAPSVTLNFPGREGQVTRRKLVASHKPTEVLSEGEQKALALADFLAEVTCVPASSPVVFDDPITSMDYRRIHEVCDRIIALAQGQSPAISVDLASTIATMGLARSVARAAAKQTGFVNAYRVYRNSLRGWCSANIKELRTIVATAERLASNDQARFDLAKKVDSLPEIPSPSGERQMAAANVITSLVACLDPRHRFPIINGEQGVTRRLSRLGLANHNLTDQVAGFIGLIGQFGLSDAFAIDTMTDQQIDAIRKQVVNATTSSGVAIGTAPLPSYDDAERKAVQDSQTITYRKRHNTMTNRLTALLPNMKLTQGTSANARYDVLVKDYDGAGRDLLIEVKPDPDKGSIRIGIGQLFDYRRFLPHQAGTDLAILTISRPPDDYVSFLQDLQITPLWFVDDRCTTLNGDGKVWKSLKISMKNASLSKSPQKDLSEFLIVSSV